MTGEHAQLAAALDAARITGNVATPRENNLLHIRRFLDQEEGFHFGVELTRHWDAQSVFALMVDKAGINPDPDHTQGQDTISAEACIAAAERYAEVLGAAVAAGEPLLFASGHPAGMLPVYASLAQAAAQAGARVLTLPGGMPVDDRQPAGGGDMRHLGGVWYWHRHGSALHTHAPEPMRALLAALAREGAEPGLVIADHGWAGAAGSAGLRTIGVADCNDPALFVAEVQGQVEVCVPLDDNVPSQLYAPLVAFIAERAGLPRPPVW